MKRDSRLSAVLHLLLHMERSENAMTSETLSSVMATNPVVIRRLLGGLRDAGYVRSEKGHGGGWRLACEPSKVTLRDIYDALGRPALFAIGHRQESPSCLVEQAVNVSLGGALDDAEALLLERFDEVSLAKLASEAARRNRLRGRQRKRAAGCGDV